ncbi:hypothetical protein Slin15195_G021920 [Septoria linicola]|uniref:Uncharacterized protein n=1 Tax=Septoria linicola TaxID=215465 RepID=A0A9Q9EH24_9PEZI|nr:hypothetical protein Slin14017_G130390 [Septoria linicola]USW48873.1 hypothetical protein Slin15195_G021920 [Septoria linicola]
MSSQYNVSASRQQPPLLRLPTWQQQASYEPAHNHSPYVDYDHNVPNGHFSRHESRLPREVSRNNSGMQRSSLLVGNNVGHLKFLPIEPPPGYPPLDYRPAMITRTATITLFFLYVGLTAGVSCLAYVPESRIAYAVHADSYYLAVKYGPAVIGAISAFLVKSVTQDLLKMLPYINMADDARSSTAQRTVLS